VGHRVSVAEIRARSASLASLRTVCTDCVKITEEAELSASDTVGPGINDMAHKVGKGERHQMHEQVGQWTLGKTCWLYSCVGSEKLTFGFGFQPKITLYFRWHRWFWPNVLRHFQHNFIFGKK